MREVMQVSLTNAWLTTRLVHRTPAIGNNAVTPLAAYVAAIAAAVAIAIAVAVQAFHAGCAKIIFTSGAFVRCATSDVEFAKSALCVSVHVN